MCVEGQCETYHEIQDCGKLEYHKEIPVAPTWGRYQSVSYNPLNKRLYATVATNLEHGVQLMLETKAYEFYTKTGAYSYITRDFDDIYGSRGSYSTAFQYPLPGDGNEYGDLDDVPLGDKLGPGQGDRKRFALQELLADVNGMDVFDATETPPKLVDHVPPRFGMKQTAVETWGSLTAILSRLSCWDSIANPVWGGVARQGPYVSNDYVTTPGGQPATPANSAYYACDYVPGVVDLFAEEDYAEPHSTVTVGNWPVDMEWTKQGKLVVASEGIGGPAGTPTLGPAGWAACRDTPEPFICEGGYGNTGSTRYWTKMGTRCVGKVTITVPPENANNLGYESNPNSNLYPLVPLSVYVVPTAGEIEPYNHETQLCGRAHLIGDQIVIDCNGKVGDVLAVAVEHQLADIDEVEERDDQWWLRYLDAELSFYDSDAEECISHSPGTIDIIDVSPSSGHMGGYHARSYHLDFTDFDAGNSRENEMCLGGTEMLKEALYLQHDQLSNFGSRASNAMFQGLNGQAKKKQKLQTLEADPAFEFSKNGKRPIGGHLPEYKNIGGRFSDAMRPSAVSVSESGRYAFVTLAFNNGVAVVDLGETGGVDECKPRIVGIICLGKKDMLQSWNRFDGRTDDGANQREWPVLALYQARGVSVQETTDGFSVLLANTGVPSYYQMRTLRKLNLPEDRFDFPDKSVTAEIMTDIENGLGNMWVFADLGKVGDQHYQINIAGGRSLSVLNVPKSVVQTGKGKVERVWDSGHELEAMVAKYSLGTFNAGFKFDDRSNLNGPAPYDIATGNVFGEMLAFASLQGGHVIAVYNIDNIEVPVFRFMMQGATAANGEVAGGDVGPGEVEFVPKGKDGCPQLLVAFSGEWLRPGTGTVVAYTFTQKGMKCAQ
eukprot:TRINITY_DN60166_c0_g1_i1.p1 TRINITY_DN60166_c0_g1~~TRINITY_DN60166_c0_g1_i1.p1  ORF type:complete len:1014 (-),score=76.26 TRINITY_DN60166_c0_g1_i1:994-3654(-)